MGTIKIQRPKVSVECCAGADGRSLASILILLHSADELFRCQEILRDSGERSTRRWAEEAKRGSLESWGVRDMMRNQIGRVQRTSKYQHTSTRESSTEADALDAPQYSNRPGRRVSSNGGSGGERCANPFFRQAQKNTQNTRDCERERERQRRRQAHRTSNQH